MTATRHLRVFAPKRRKMQARAKSVHFSDKWFGVVLYGKREVVVPLSWYPPLKKASFEQRYACTFVERSTKIVWPNLGLVVAVRHLLEA